MKLQYREDGTFRIMQFTDTHIGNKPYNKQDQETFKLIQDALSYFDVDLVMHTGDIIWSDGVKDAHIIFKEVMELYDKSEAPVALTYGNHDSEEIITRDDLSRIFEENVSNRAKKQDVFHHDERESYTLPIFSHEDGEIENILYVMDTGADAPLPIGGYDWNQPEQVEWFRKTSAKYKKNDNIKRNIVFQHIPVPEYWEASEEILSGEHNEKISSPYINTGLFANMLLNNETWGMFVGHDHDNDFDALLYGIHLIFGNVSGFNTYGDMERGVRIIELNDKTKEIETYTVKYSTFKK